MDISAIRTDDFCRRTAPTFPANLRGLEIFGKSKIRHPSFRSFTGELDIWLYHTFLSYPPIRLKYE